MDQRHGEQIGSLGPQSLPELNSWVKKSLTRSPGLAGSFESEGPWQHKMQVTLRVGRRGVCATFESHAVRHSLAAPKRHSRSETRLRRAHAQQKHTTWQSAKQAAGQQHRVGSRTRAGFNSRFAWLLPSLQAQSGRVSMRLGRVENIWQVISALAILCLTFHRDTLPVDGRNASLCLSTGILLPAYRRSTKPILYLRLSLLVSWIIGS